MIGFAQGLRAYFPYGLHDAFFSDIVFDFKREELRITFNSIVGQSYTPVVLVSQQVQALTLSGEFEVFSDDNEVMDLTVDGSKMLIKGRKWEIGYHFGEIGWTVPM